MASDEEEDYPGFYFALDEAICDYYLTAPSVPFFLDNSSGEKKKITIVGSGNWWVKGLLVYSKTCVKWPLKNKQNKDLNDHLSLNAGRKYCEMLLLEHSAILLTCIKR